MAIRPIDTRYQQLREAVTNEAAKALDTLNGEHNSDVVLWETLLVASERSPLVQRLASSPGVFIAAIYNTYGQGEYLKWRDSVTEKLQALHPVDHQG